MFGHDSMNRKILDLSDTIYLNEGRSKAAPARIDDVASVSYLITVGLGAYLTRIIADNCGRGRV